MSILTIDHISKYYNLDGTNQERALNDVTLEIAPAKITAIYGPSGCGKTSLLSIISGLDSQYQGNGYLKTKTHNFSDSEGIQHSKEHSYWTQKGRLFLYDLLKQHDVLPLMEV